MRASSFVKDDFVTFLTAVKIAGELARASDDPAHLAFAADCAETAERLRSFIAFADRANDSIASQMALVCPECGFSQTP